MTQNSTVWDCMFCPPEVLLMIFELLDIKSLRNCLFVNKRWKEIAEYTFQHFGLWQKLTVLEMDYGAAVLKTKSNLDWKGIFENSHLWWIVRKAKIQHIHTYKIDVQGINIYQDNLIVVTSKSVIYFNVESFEKIKEIHTTNCVAFEENDYMVVQVIKNENSEKTLCMHGKMNPGDFNLCLETKKELALILNIYKLEGNLCYAMDLINVLRIYEWKEFQWKDAMQARYYGSLCNICAIRVYSQHVYILLKTRQVLWNYYKGCLMLKMVYRIRVPPDVTDDDPYLCFKLCAVVAVKDENSFEINLHDEYHNFTMLCPGLSYAIEHGNILVLAYKTGKIEIWIACDMTKDKVPELVYNLNLQKDETIEGLDVCETMRSHHLFVVTNIAIHQLHITHPDTEIYAEETPKWIHF